MDQTEFQNGTIVIIVKKKMLIASETSSIIHIAIILLHHYVSTEKSICQCQTIVEQQAINNLSIGASKMIRLCNIDVYPFRGTSRLNSRRFSVKLRNEEAINSKCFNLLICSSKTFTRSEYLSVSQRCHSSSRQSFSGSSS